MRAQEGLRGERDLPRQSSGPPAADELDFLVAWPARDSDCNNGERLVVQRTKLKVSAVRKRDTNTPLELDNLFPVALLAPQFPAACNDEP